ncbi:MAG: excinuclease ABC subunit UvrC [Campylobacterota bacterium]|nr:excinuclease ABC subunit UvrC [Campylobacterota bacterium]
MLQQIQSLPHRAGVYQYFDKSNRLLYIGKAKNLNKRVKSYFRFTPKLHTNPTLNPRIIKMISEAVTLNYIIVENEHDALILENSLIKQLKPKYNILLRDDKTYPYIYIDKSEEFPRFEITRRVIKGKNINYFGPYSIAAREILDSIYELCTLVQKKGCLKGKKACLYHQLKKCEAPCEEKITSQDYSIIVNKAINYIENKKLLVDDLHVKMLTLAEQLRFEEATQLRDTIERIKKSTIHSQIDLATKEHYDIFCVVNSESRAVILKLFMRHGKVVSTAHNIITIKNDFFDRDEAYERAILEFYGSGKPPVIAPILVADPFSNSPLVEKHLSTLFEKKASINAPIRGPKKSLVSLARTNAQELLKHKVTSDDYELLKALQELCELQNLPERIEVFDNSHMAAQATVGAMIVYNNGNFEKSSYRKYHLDAKDEYAQMRETLNRRIESFVKNSPPDLWLIDGGQTLLKLARELLDSAGVNLDVIAISKEKIDAKSYRAKGKAHDILHVINKPIKLLPTDKRLLWMQRLRDEAHRSAISFHKQTKLKADNELKMLNAKGISIPKIKKLLQHFGTFKAIKSADFDDIASILNEKDANNIKKIYM